MKLSRAALGLVLTAALLGGCGGSDAPSSNSLAAQLKQLIRSDKDASAAATAMYQDQVQSLYIAYFGRPGGPAGIAYWVGQMQDGLPLVNVGESFALNAVYIASIPGLQTVQGVPVFNTTSANAVVTNFYANLFGTTPSAAGLSYWATQLLDGSESINNLGAAIVVAGQSLNNATIANKLAVADYFTAQLASQNAANAYAGTNAFLNAHSMLSSVNGSTNVTAFEATAASTVAAIANQNVFESFALNGGEATISANVPYGGGNMVAGTNYIYATTFNVLNQSPLSAGPQLAISSNTSLDNLLTAPSAGNTRVLQGGQIWLLSGLAQRKISYVGSQVQVQALAADGQTVLRTTQFYNYSESSLSGTVGNSPEALFAAVPVNDWIKFNNFSANAKWNAGAAYLTKQGGQVGDIIFAADCTNTSTPTYTSGTSPTPCQSGVTLDNFFPISLVDSNSHPTETEFATDGAITTVQGLRMWIAGSPFPEEMSPTQEYRVYYEMNGNVYEGILEKDGTPFLYQQADGSTVSYTLSLNQAAVASMQQGVITGAVAAGSKAGIAATVGQTADLFGIGGSGVNGSLAPADLRKHYNIPVTLTGAGQTVAIVDGPGSGDVSDDLDVYSQYYNLPLCDTANGCFLHIDLSNGAAVSASNDSGAEVELDAQMVHAIAPAAHIVLVTAKSMSTADLYAAVNYAAAFPGVTAVSMSFGGSGYSTTQDAQFAAFQVKGGPAFFASSGDSGHSTLAQYPASSPYVTAVGGTRINAISWTSSASESAWQYSGGGLGQNIMPSWQSASLSTAMYGANIGLRAVPDVAAVADPQHSAVSIYYKDSWVLAGGTSASAPIWAGIAALVGQSLASQNQSLGSLIAATPGGFNGLLYQMSPYPSGGGAFYDAVSGSNNLTNSPCSICTALPGYDDLTGLGAPNVAVMVANLAVTATPVACNGIGGNGYSGLSFTNTFSFLISTVAAGQLAADTLDYSIEYNNPGLNSTAWSGSLRIQFWVANSNYEGAAMQGYLLATLVPNFGGQYAYSSNQIYNDAIFNNVVSVAAGTNPPAGTYCPVAVLQEYGIPGCTASDGYCTIDWRNGVNPWTFQ